MEAAVLKKQERDEKEIVVRKWGEKEKRGEVELPLLKVEEPPRCNR